MAWHHFARMSIATAAALGAVLLGGCSEKDGPAPPAAGTATAAPATAAPTGQAQPSPTAPAPSPTPALTGVCPPNPDPAPATVAVVTQPLPNAAVQSPLTVTGMVEAFEATFQAQLLDAQQNQLAHVVGMSQAGQVLSPFSVQLTFSVSAPTPGCLRIYQQSAKDGSDTKIVHVPVVLMP